MTGSATTGPAMLGEKARTPRKFADPLTTADGAVRARVPVSALRTLWINTGTLCNLTCTNCYIESSPTNDALVYISAAEVAQYLDEIADLGLPTTEIGFTGGEPFMNPDICAMLRDAMERGHRALVLTNGMKPMWHRRADLVDLRRTFGDRLSLRVSLDHYARDIHETLRGPRSWEPAVSGLRWLVGEGFPVAVAGRNPTGESETALRAGYQRLFDGLGLDLDAQDPVGLVLFPEMDETADVPEITEACWGILGLAPQTVMCASSRMVVKPRGAAAPSVVSCTLLPHAEGFSMGRTLREAIAAEVPLNHPHCARFCVLGGASCSQG